MRSNPLVSIIVPVYNTENYLRECINSLCGQTYSNLQIILVNDGSTDGCGKICDFYMKKDSRIQVIHQENRGVSSARNVGLDVAQGKYIYFVDSDDRVLENMVEETVGAMEEGYDLCVWAHLIEEESNTYYWGRHKSTIFHFPTLRKKRRFLCRWILPVRFCWSACCQAFRRDIINCNELRFVTGQKIYEDMDFFFRYAACCQNLHYISKSFYVYRQHADSTFHTSTIQEQTAYMLRLSKLWDSSFAEQLSFLPVYICSGVAFLSGVAGHITRTKDDEQRLIRILEFLRNAEDNDWLLEQAKLAVKNRSVIIQICGLRLGGRVYGFYKYLLTGDMSSLRKANRLQACFLMLRTCKNRLLYGQ